MVPSPTDPPSVGPSRRNERGNEVARSDSHLIRPPRARRFKVAGVVIDRLTGTLTRGEERIELEPRVFAVLEHLIRNRGRPVTKNELLDEVWEGAYVTEHAVWRTISKLRQAFQDDPKRPRVIATLPKRGYVLVAEIEPVTSTQGRDSGFADRPGSVRKVRWAVVGLSAALVALAGVAVVKRTSSASIAPPTSWAENAASISGLEALDAKGRLEPRERARLSVAYSRQWTSFSSSTSDRRWVTAAMAAADKAIREAPERPEGHTAMAYALRAAGRLEEAVEAYKHALALDSTFLAAANDLGHLLRERGELIEALRWHDRVLAERADYYPSRMGRARALLLLGRYQEAEVDALRALEDEPELAGGAALLVRLALLGGDAHGAEKLVARFEPRFSADPAFLEAAAAAAHLNGDLATALRRLRRATGSAHKGGIGPAALRLAAVARQLGDEPLYRDLSASYAAWIRAEEAAGTEHWRPALWRAAFSSLEGDRESAVGQLEEAVRRGFRDVSWIGLDPIFRGVHDSRLLRDLTEHATSL